MNYQIFFKIYLLFILLMLPINLFSQNQKFVYEYKYITDSTNLESIKTELMFLDTTPNFSKFYSAETYKNDSISQVSLDKQIAATGRIDNIPKTSSSNKSTIKYTIIKNYSDNDLFFINRIGRYKYKVKDNRAIKWTILPDKDVFNAHNLQKATTEFGGRKWIAWFTTDIPIQDGPYKFKGLPGMIMKIEDTTKSHSFKLVGLKNLSNKELKNINPTGNFVFDFGDNLDISFSKYKKVFLEARDNPIKSIQQTLKDLDEVNVNGTMVDKNTYLRDREVKLKAAIQKDNNIIEIDMLRK